MPRARLIIEIESKLVDEEARGGNCAACDALIFGQQVTLATRLKPEGEVGRRFRRVRRGKKWRRTAEFCSWCGEQLKENERNG